MLLPTMPAPMTTTRARVGKRTHAREPSWPGRRTVGGLRRKSIARAGLSRPRPGRIGPPAVTTTAGPPLREVGPAVDAASRRHHPALHSAPSEGPVPSLFIDGEWTSPASGATQDVVNPSDATVVTQVDVADDADVQRAIAAARRAFDAGDWPRSPVGERVALLNRTADLLERDRDKVARAETLNTGKALRESCWDVDDVIKVFRYYAGPRRQGDRPPRRDAGQGRGREDRLRADRGVRADRAVELPAPADVVEGRPGARGRRHDRHEAGLATRR